MLGGEGGDRGERGGGTGFLRRAECKKKKKLKKQILRGLLMWDRSEILRTKREGAAEKS